MNDGDLNKFLEKVMRFQDGCLSEKEIKNLEAEMLKSEEKRKIFSETMVISQSISDQAQQNAKPSKPVTSSFSFKPFLRSCAILALGAILGVSSISVANAFSKNISPFEPFLSFFESFENGPEPLEQGIPLKAEVWGGDSTTQVQAEQGITPYKGNSMLRMLKADFPSKPVPGGYVSEVYRWVDLNSVKQYLFNDKAEVTLSTVANAVQTADDDLYFCGLSVYAYESIPDFVIPTLDAFTLRDTSIATACRQQILFDKDIKSWQTINLDMTLPASTRYLLIRFAVSREKLDRNQAGFTFPGHYIDDFKVLFRPKVIIDEKQ